MTRTTVTGILAIYFVIVLTAAIIRVDRFPLTWVPMYSTYKPRPDITARVVDEERMEKGLFITRRDGSTGYIGKQDLNISKWHFWRLYYQRMFGIGPAKHRQGNMNLSSFNRWIRGLEEGELNFSAEWDWRILHSLNRTLGYTPSDPQFIVRAEADYEQLRFLKQDVLKGNMSAAERKRLHATVLWKDEWNERW